MKLIGPDEYHLTITGRSATVTAKDGTPHFVFPATAKKKPKLYVASKDGTLLYVGKTTQPMSVRLRGGFTADGAHGYHGYSWAKVNHSICLHIWYLDATTTEQNDLETIEAETVFLYRLQSGQWPAAQTEIHFFPSDARHRACAQQIVESLKKDCEQGVPGYRRQSAPQPEP